MLAFLRLILVLVFCVPLTLVHAEQVDLKLVLALDASSSVDQQEYNLQLNGIAKSLRDPDVQAAIEAGPRKKIAINVVIWAQPSSPKQTTGWVVVSNAQQAEAFADVVTAMPRLQKGGTGIGAGISAALDALDTSVYESSRNVIDVSGDGRETLEFYARSMILSQARKAAEARGVIINGLAVTADDPDLFSYYSEEVRSGPFSFVMMANGYSDFARAMQLKLIREIEQQPIAMR